MSRNGNSDNRLEATTVAAVVLIIIVVSLVGTMIVLPFLDALSEKYGTKEINTAPIREQPSAVKKPRPSIRRLSDIDPERDCFATSMAACPVGYFSLDPFADEMARVMGFNLLTCFLRTDPCDHERMDAVSRLRVRRFDFRISEADWKAIEYSANLRFRHIARGQPELRDEAPDCASAIEALDQVIVPVFEQYSIGEL